MGNLFVIETDGVVLNWGSARGGEPEPLPGLVKIPGRLVIKSRRYDLAFGAGTHRLGVPESVAHDPGLTIGPTIYEETDYKIYIHGKNGQKVSIRNRDPQITSDLSTEHEGRVIHGYINFGSQVGRSLFSLSVAGKPELDFEIEVFPSKLDYATDYTQLLAEVQEILTGLVLEYLRSTFQLGRGTQVPQPSSLEWLVLLRHIIDDLESALRQINLRPSRDLIRDSVNTRIERIKRIDPCLRSNILRQKGSGRLAVLPNGVVMRRRVNKRRPRETLNTAEHRWLALQLNLIRRRLGELRRVESQLPKSNRRRQAMRELTALEMRIARLGKFAPLASAEGPPPPGFSSLRLQVAPGYREAYRACLILALGLRIEGGPINLSIKDLSLLYEYWCYLALLKTISQQIGQPIPVKQLFSVQRQGIRVLLQKGREHKVHFDAENERSITITYNPLFSGDPMVIPQQPDMLITFKDKDWPTLHLVLDAKYRVDASRRYIKRYQTPGPPEDAINILHRYRDAILEHDKNIPAPRPKHTVIQAAAVFPYREEIKGRFESSSLWGSLERIGIGALPLLPDNVHYLSRWLHAFLHKGGWELADQAPIHRTAEYAYHNRVAASEFVLVGVLRSPGEKEHLKWIQEKLVYYMPLLKTQRRQLAAKWVALYSPTSIRKPGAVTHFGPVRFLYVIPRNQIKTPWATSNRKRSKQLYVVYQLGYLNKLEAPIDNKNDLGQGQRFSIHRWTSRLALKRAEILEELLLETESEWRLYEQLKVHGVDFSLVPRRAVLPNQGGATGRVWFRLDNGVRVRFAGASGFLVSNAGQESYYPRVGDVVRYVQDF